jgi:hypothetical protein
VRFECEGRYEGVDRTDSSRAFRKGFDAHEVLFEDDLRERKSLNSIYPFIYASIYQTEFHLRSFKIKCLLFTLLSS